MLLRDFIISLSNSAISKPQSYLSPGNNGPYYDPETPVRNTSHWIITLAKCYEWTGEHECKSKLRSLSNYLLTRDARPYGFSFHHRYQSDIDKCNGLIGQAWTFEALAKASEILEDPQYAQLAEEVFFQHHFNEQYGLWNRLEIDGKVLSIDPTFNHQLWFAACVSLLKTPQELEIKKRVVRFIDCLLENIIVMHYGLIYHLIERKLNDEFSVPSLKVWIKKTVVGVLNSLGLKKNKQKSIDVEEGLKRMIHKSIGYHQFNMYAFAMLKEQMPDHSFWKSEKFNKMVNYMLIDEYKNGLEDNKFGYPYNPPGFEVPYALCILADKNHDELIDQCSWWINEQFRRCYNHETGLMDRNTEDPITHTARVYESTRIPDSISKNIVIKGL